MSLKCESRSTEERTRSVNFDLSQTADRLSALLEVKECEKREGGEGGEEEGRGGEEGGGGGGGGEEGGGGGEGGEEGGGEVQGRFKAKIRPDQSSAAEEELRREIRSKVILKHPFIYVYYTYTACFFFFFVFSINFFLPTLQ